MSIALSNSVPTEAELNSYEIIAKVAASNPFWRKLGGGGDEKSVVATILSVMLLARELGISPMQAISGGINNIQGKFEISARLMNQLIRKFGHQLEVTTLTHEVCQIWGKRKDTGEEMEVTYHIEEAARAKLIKEGGGWQKNPQDMLFARAISRLARRLYPDCIGGCYIEGELQESIQGKAVEGIEMPALSEINVHVKEEPIILSLPEYVSSVRVEEYLAQSASISKKSISEIRERASKNFDAFLKSFKEWEQKEYPQALEAATEEVLEMEEIEV